MPYNSDLAERVRKTLKRRRGITERKMFGGLAFMLNGNMCCGVIEKDLVLRLGDDGAAMALSKPHTRPMDFTGKPLKSMVFVSFAGYRSDDELKAWVSRAVDYVKTLPAK